jgi:hypothetical protein
MTKFILQVGEPPTSPESRGKESKVGYVDLYSGDCLRINNEVLFVQNIGYDPAIGKVTLTVERKPVATLKQFWTSLFKVKNET